MTVRELRGIVNEMRLKTEGEAHVGIEVCSSSGHENLLDLRQRRVFVEPLALGGIFGAQCVLNVGVSNC